VTKGFYGKFLIRCHVCVVDLVAEEERH
jgi:hypothetical protein